MCVCVRVCVCLFVRLLACARAIHVVSRRRVTNSITQSNWFADVRTHLDHHHATQLLHIHHARRPVAPLATLMECACVCVCVHVCVRVCMCASESTWVYAKV